MRRGVGLEHRFESLGSIIGLVRDLSEVLQMLRMLHGMIACRIGA